VFGASGPQEQLSEDAARGQPLVRLGGARELEAARDARVEAPGRDRLEDGGERPRAVCAGAQVVVAGRDPSHGQRSGPALAGDPREAPGIERLDRPARLPVEHERARVASIARLASKLSRPPAS
jgi:hypothetical protein